MVIVVTRGAICEWAALTTTTAAHVNTRAGGKQMERNSESERCVSKIPIHQNNSSGFS